MSAFLHREAVSKAPCSPDLQLGAAHMHNDKCTNVSDHSRSHTPGFSWRDGGTCKAMLGVLQGEQGVRVGIAVLRGAG